MLLRTLLNVILLLQWHAMSQMPYPQPGQYGPSVNVDYYQQQQMYSQQQQQQSIYNQQQPQQSQQGQQTLLNQQQQSQQGQQGQQAQQTILEAHQPQAQKPIPNNHHQQQAQVSVDERQNQPSNSPSSQSQSNQPFDRQNPQVPSFHYQQQQSAFGQQPLNIDPSVRQPEQQIYPQQQHPYYQGNIPEQPVQYHPFAPQNPNGQQPNSPNQYYLPTNNKPMGENFPSTNGGSLQRYLVGNLSQPFSFKLAEPPRKVMHWSLNGDSIYINGMGLSDKFKFTYDEQNNLLTIRSLDRTTVGYYTAVDPNWQTVTTVVNAIDVSSLKILNFQSSDDDKNASSVLCQVSIIRSTFKLSDASPPIPEDRQPIGMYGPNPFPSTPLDRPSASSNGAIDQLPRLDISLSTRTSQSVLPNSVAYNDVLNNEMVTRMITMQRPLTRADHNGTILCRVESNNNVDVYLSKSVQVQMEYGPEFEAGAIATATLESEALKMISIECQINGNPSPSYTWYEIASTNNTSSDMMSYYGQQNTFGSYPSRPIQSMPSAGLSVFGTTKQIQRLYQHPGRYTMQCQAQSRGKTVKQDFIVLVQASSDLLRDSRGNVGSEKSSRIPMIIGIVVGAVVLLLIISLVIAGIIFMNRRKKKDDYRHNSEGNTREDNETKSNRTNPRGNNRSDNRYRQQGFREDSSSRSHLVESADSNSNHVAPTTNRSSPETSRNPSVRQLATSGAISYVPAASGSGFRPISQHRSYSPDPDEIDGEVAQPYVSSFANNNRSKTSTPFGSHKSLSESLHSLRSNQQRPVRLPTKTRSDEPPPLPPPLIPKRDQKSPSVDVDESKRDYQHHHYHNPAQMRAEQQRGLNSRISSDEDEQEINQRYNNQSEDAAFIPKKTTFRVAARPGDQTRPLFTSTIKSRFNGPNQETVNQSHAINNRRTRTPPPSQRIVVHQPSETRRDESPPSYQHVSKPLSSQITYVFQEPTEV